jgi:hypothetical protein
VALLVPVSLSATQMTVAGLRTAGSSEPMPLSRKTIILMGVTAPTFFTLLRCSAFRLRSLHHPILRAFAIMHCRPALWLIPAVTR